MLIRLVNHSRVIESGCVELKLTNTSTCDLHAICFRVRVSALDPYCNVELSCCESRPEEEEGEA